MLNCISNEEQFAIYKKYYLVSNYGRVYSLRTDKFLKLNKNSKGYCRFEYSNTKKSVRHRKQTFIHIVVVSLFGDRLGNKINNCELEKMDIDHLDRNKNNNAYNNLELVTHLENVQRFYRQQQKQDTVAEVLPY
jgi:hypothetical protein